MFKQYWILLVRIHTGSLINEATNKPRGEWLAAQRKAGENPVIIDCWKITRAEFSALTRKE
jgi:hypothetical protein